MGDVSIIARRNPLYKLFDNYKTVYNYFDDWIVVRATEDGCAVKEIAMKKSENSCIETIFWE